MIISDGYHLPYGTHLLNTIMRLTAAEDRLRADHIQGTTPLRSSHVFEEVKQGELTNPQSAAGKQPKPSRSPSEPQNVASKATTFLRIVIEVSACKESIKGIIEQGVRAVFPGRHNRMPSQIIHGKKDQCHGKGCI